MDCLCRCTRRFMLSRMMDDGAAQQPIGYQGISPAQQTALLLRTHVQPHGVGEPNIREAQEKADALEQQELLQLEGMDFRIRKNRTR